MARRGNVSSHSYGSTERHYRKYDCRHSFVLGPRQLDAVPPCRSRSIPR